MWSVKICVQEPGGTCVLWGLCELTAPVQACIKRQTAEQWPAEDSCPSEGKGQTDRQILYSR